MYQNYQNCKITAKHLNSDLLVLDHTNIQVLSKPTRKAAPCLLHVARPQCGCHDVTRLTALRRPKGYKVKMTASKGIRLIDLYM